MADHTPVPPQKTEVAKTTWLKPSLFGGRFTRKQYFWRMLLVPIISVFLQLELQGTLLLLCFGEMLRGAGGFERYLQACMLIYLLTNIPVMILFYLPFGIKRAHDIGHKGTFLIVLTVIALIVQWLGLISMESYIIFFVIWSIPALIYGCILLFKDSQKGTNAYGTSTKYPDTVA